MNELLYPLLQGYDSVAMDVDLEIGATDQTFNMLVGRRLQKLYNNKEKFILTTPLLMGLDGRKMSKTYKNAINILDEPKEMYGKLMSIKDELIPHYFDLCTDIAPERTQGMSRRDAKAELAKEVVRIYHGEKKAEQAEHEFTQVFHNKEAPKDMPTVHVTKNNMPLDELLVEIGLANSKSEGRRLVEQGGVRINKEIQKNGKKDIRVEAGWVIQVGKRKFVKIK